MDVNYYFANGLCVKTEGNIDLFCIEEYTVQTANESIKNYYFKKDEIINEIENTVFSVDNMLKVKIFGGIDEYYDSIKTLPMYISICGHETELRISKDELVKLCDNHTELYNKYMYYFDCLSILDSIMNNIVMTKHKFISFYKELSKIELNIDDEKEVEMVVSGEKIINVFSYLESLIISLYSIFDLTTKIAIELENMPEEYKSCPKLRASKKLFGDKKKIKNIKFEKTIFEKSKQINFVENMRNELIHNGSWQSVNRVYLFFSKRNVKEKYIFMPDINSEGHLQKYKNRQRFYSDDLKINMELPELYIDILYLINNTLFKLHYNREDYKSELDKDGVKLYKKYHAFKLNSLKV